MTHTIPDGDSFPSRPLLKWAGGKRWLVPHLRDYWTSGGCQRRLVEPFCGGLAVTLGLVPGRALLNDVNPHLINFYQWVQRGLSLTISPENNEEHYYGCRDRFNRLLACGERESREAAELFYYLNRTGYNGLCRFNKQGGFNVPFGTYKRIRYSPTFLEYQPLFARFEFSSTDFQQMPLEDSDFVYADPPYDVEFTAYSQGGFSWADQVRTAEWLAGHPGPVVLSNQATPRIKDLYHGLGYTLRELPAPRQISCTGDRTPAQEVLAVRNLCSVDPHIDR